MITTKYCLSCNSELHGRADKKFCDDQCRTTYNNQFKINTNVIKDINAILKKNRKILHDLTPAEQGKTTVTEKKLLEKGFNFNYLTHHYITKAGTRYTFCYEYGYLKLEGSLYMLVKRQSE
jgi:hypothetical protein